MPSPQFSTHFESGFDRDLRPLTRPSNQNARESSTVGPPPRDALLRLALFATILGAVLAIVYSFFLASYNDVDAYFGFDAVRYHEVVVPVTVIGAVAGVLIVDKQPVLGMLLGAIGTLLSLGGGGIYLVPGVGMTCTWAVRHSIFARAVMGYLLLVPGVIAGFYALSGLLAYSSGKGMPPSLETPTSVREALQPALLLPLAFVGAWLLVRRDGQSRR